MVELFNLLDKVLIMLFHTVFVVVMLQKVVDMEAGRAHIELFIVFKAFSH
jgi:hypothetical protein